MKNAKNKHERKKWIEKARTGDWYQSERPSYTELAWKQEFEGAFDANEGTVFTTRQIEKTFQRNYLEYREHPVGMVETWYTSEKQNHQLYATGIDLGRRHDATVIITYDYRNKPATLVDYKYIPAGHADWSQIIRLLRQHIEYWGGEVLHDGTGQGDPVTDALAGLSEPFKFTKEGKEDLITSAQTAMDKQLLRMPKIETMYNEHQRYIWDDKDITQDTVMANLLAIKVFYEADSVYTGVDKDFSYVGV
jgi:hypothetical protein